MKKIAVIPNPQKDVDLLNTRRVIECLAGKVKVFMTNEYSAIGMNVNYVDEEEMYKTVETALVLGGDGTIIQCAGNCAKNHVPVLGVNLGRIGFMTEIEVADIEAAIDKLLHNEYRIENRMLLKMNIMRNKKVISSRCALNDVVISKTISEKLIGIELYANKELVNRYMADGLIISTPTGSTGYSISAGGPVVDPMMQLYIATPICAHMLSVRSAILSADKDIIIKLDRNMADHEGVVTTDGEVDGNIGLANEVKITRSEYDFELIKIGNRSFYTTLLSKLS